jgi:hypothetical protein
VGGSVARGFVKEVSEARWHVISIGMREKG